MISQPKKKSFAIEQVSRENDALVLTSQRGLLRLSPVNDSILRVTYTELEAFSEEKSLGICCDDRLADWQYTEDANTITLTLPKFTATVDRRTGTIRYHHLTPDELGLLLWSIALEDGCYHSIGRGRPYGYGRVRIRIDGLKGETLNVKVVNK